MIAGGTKSERSVIERVSDPLDRPVEIGSRRVRKKEMLKSFGEQAPASDERIAQDERGVVPDKTIPERGRISSENQRGQKKGREDFFTDAIGLTEAIRCAFKFGKCLSQRHVTLDLAF